MRHKTDQKMKCPQYSLLHSQCSITTKASTLTIRTSVSAKNLLHIVRNRAITAIFPTQGVELAFISGLVEIDAGGNGEEVVESIDGDN